MNKPLGTLGSADSYVGSVARRFALTLGVSVLLIGTLAVADVSTAGPRGRPESRAPALLFRSTPLRSMAVKTISESSRTVAHRSLGTS